MRKNQSGAVLAISLVLLTAITFLSMMGMQRSGLQTKIVANIQHQESVFNAALDVAEGSYRVFQESDTQALSDAMEVRKNYNYQASSDNADLSNVEGPGKHLNNVTTANSKITVAATVTYKSNDNDPGNPNTSGLRQSFSRGKQGTGLAKFELLSSAKFKNDISSTQALGFQITTPEQ